MKRHLIVSGRRRPAGDELGAHVSSAGGVHRAPERAAQLRSAVLQLFTKAPGRWADPEIGAGAIARFHAERVRHRITCAAIHDAYLINLASRDRRLFRRSYVAFRNELARGEQLGIEYVVTHPGNAIGDRIGRAIERNARGVTQALTEVPGRIRVLFETTAGTGTALGARFEQLARLIASVSPAVRHRVGVCFDTCHVWAAGYDLRHDYDGVFAQFDEIIGLGRLRFFHLNDSVHALGSRRDRHAHIGKGMLGPKPFERLVNDSRFAHVPKVLETPKDDDAVRSDRANLRRLRRWRDSAIDASRTALAHGR